MSSQTAASALRASPGVSAVDPLVATTPPWGTLAWGLAIYFGSKFYGSIVFMIILMRVDVFPGPQPSESEILQFERHMGFLDMVFGSTCATAGILFTFVAARWGRRLPPLQEYLGLILPTMRQALVWTIGFAVLKLAESTLFLESPTWIRWLEVYSNALSLPALWLYVIVIGPIFEELLYRGFLLPGLAASRLRPVGALLVTTALFTLMHHSYHYYALMMVFASGLLYGAVRLATGSVWLCCSLHMLNNAYAVCLMEFTLRGG